jgi:hypothetical protein
MRVLPSCRRRGACAAGGVVGGNVPASRTNRAGPGRPHFLPPRTPRPQRKQYWKSAPARGCAGNLPLHTRRDAARRGPGKSEGGGRSEHAPRCRRPGVVRSGGGGGSTPYHVTHHHVTVHRVTPYRLTPLSPSRLTWDALSGTLFGLKLRFSLPFAGPYRLCAMCTSCV